MTSTMSLASRICLIRAARSSDKSPPRRQGDHRRGKDLPQTVFSVRFAVEPSIESPGRQSRETEPGRAEGGGVVRIPYPTGIGTAFKKPPGNPRSSAARPRVLLDAALKTDRLSSGR